MATAIRMTPEEHKEIFQAISESVVTEPEAPKKKPKTRNDVDPRALRGALYLDEHHPGWADKINLATFNISHASECVVGQIAGNYWNDASKLFPIKAGGDERAYDFGILPDDNNGMELNRSWKILISERQKRSERRKVAS